MKVTFWMMLAAKLNRNSDSIKYSSKNLENLIVIDKNARKSNDNLFYSKKNIMKKTKFSLQKIKALKTQQHQ